MLKLKKSAPRRALAEVLPNSGQPTAPAPVQWVLQSPLPWVNSVTLWPMAPHEEPIA